MKEKTHFEHEIKFEQKQGVKYKQGICRDNMEFGLVRAKRQRDKCGRGPKQFPGSLGA